MYVCLSACLPPCNKAGTDERIFMKCDIEELYLNSVSEFKFWLKSDDKYGHLHEYIRFSFAWN
jgi:hypothetical protein